eukprot:754086-Hanusia_phi.AAC.13
MPTRRRVLVAVVALGLRCSEHVRSLVDRGEISADSDTAQRQEHAGEEQWLWAPAADDRSDMVDTTSGCVLAACGQSGEQDACTRAHG